MMILADKSRGDRSGQGPPLLAPDHQGGVNEEINMNRDSERTDPKRKPRFPRLVLKRRLREIEDEMLYLDSMI